MVLMEHYRPRVRCAECLNQHVLRLEIGHCPPRFSIDSVVVVRFSPVADVIRVERLPYDRVFEFLARR